jgi:uncharacterized protein (DUF1697 family)
MSPRAKPVSTHVALLRGINVGGKNVIKMEALRRSFESMGFSSVRTLIASGNVVFDAPRAGSRMLEAAIEKVLSKDHRTQARVVVRSLAEYERMMRAIPARWGSDKTRRHYVMFLRDAIDRPSLLDELEVNPEVEEVRYVPGALLWSARLDGLGRSKMRKVMGKPIYQDMTVRNVNTTRKMHQVMAGGPGPRGMP